MALLFMDGFDAGDFLQKGWSITGSVVTSATTRFGSGRSLNVTNSTSATHRFASSSSVAIGYAISYTAVDYSPRCISLLGDNATTNHLNFKWTNSTNFALQLNGTTIASAAVPLTLNTWYYFEIIATIADAGSCLVKLNGTTIINFTGDTRNGGTIAAVDTFQVQNSTSNTGALIDDLYICDTTGPAPYNTLLGDSRIVTLSPTAAGASTQLTPDTGNNYDRVNEIPYSASNYVSGSTPALRDTYAMTDLPANVATVHAVQNNVIAKRTSTGFIAVKPAIKSGASVYYGTAQSTSTTDSVISDLRTVDPNTSAAWTVSGVNSLEAGLEIA